MQVQETLREITSKMEWSRIPSIFIWGAPGIGKSSMIRNFGKELGISVVDVRLSQLAPTDLRGLPTVNHDTKRIEWYPGDFLPRSDSKEKGILFVDEFNMCTGSMMGVAQQLILDKKVGDYSLPPNWIIIGAGNRAADRAAVNVMPAPVANRFIHLHMEPKLDEFKEVVYKYFEVSDETKGIILGFLNFKPDQLFNFKPGMLEFPSQRSWENAAHLLEIGLSTEHAIGLAATTQLNAYMKLFKHLPDLTKILAGGDQALSVKYTSTEPSVAYATISGLISRAKTIEQQYNGFEWLLNNDSTFTDDYKGLYVSEIVAKLKATDPDQLTAFIQLLLDKPNTKKFITRYRKLVTSWSA